MSTVVWSLEKLGECGSCVGI